jgi:peptidyl-prolyl cis-trans isomerase B (cyclophilin B)
MTIRLALVFLMAVGLASGEVFAQGGVTPGRGGATSQTAKPQTPRPATPAGRGRDAPAPTYFTTPYPLDELRGKQAVIQTSMGAIVVQLLPEAAPNHVGLFVKTAREGGYDGTLIHRVVRYGIIQGGDPLTKDLTKEALYGSGGLNQLKFEPNSEKHTAGTLAAALSGEPDSGGVQFFISVTDQPGFDGKYTAFGRVVEGIEIVQGISAVTANAEGRPATPVKIERVTIRDTPPEPFVNATVAEMGAARVTVETNLGTLELGMLPDKAPQTVRAFLRMVAAGVYDGIKIHRVAPNFVMQTGALAYRSEPLRASQQRLVGNLPAEFTDTPNVPGIVSMARGDDPNSASTSFFICIGECRALDGTYTVFARVTGGDDVLKKIASVPVDGETPRSPLDVIRVRVE